MPAQKNLVKLSSEMIHYACQQLAIRAGIAHGGAGVTSFEPLGVTIHYGKPDEVRSANSYTISVIPCAPGAWEFLLERAPNSLCWIPASETVPLGMSLPFDDPVPVLLWGEGYEDGNKPFAELCPDGAIVFYADIIAATFFMLSRWEETVVPTRDQHGRFPGMASVAYKQGFLDRPIVDEYALILREWMKALLPSWEPEPRLFAVRLSHDMDMVRRFSSRCRGVRTIGRALIMQRDLGLAWQSLMGTLRVESDPYFQGLQTLINLSKDYGLDSAFYFMAVPPAPFDKDLRLSAPIVKHCIQLVRAEGFEIGFHPSSHAFDNFERFLSEKKALEVALGTSQFGGRQHNLLFQVPNTWRYWEQAGLAYDSTMGYADHEGFRCGTCYPFHPFDIEANRELGILEVPLIVMDATLRQHRNLTCEQAENRILELAQRCRQVGGTFTLLWHNSSLSGEWRAWAEMYRQVLGMLEKMGEGDANSGANATV